MKVGMQLYSIHHMVEEGNYQDAVRLACSTDIDGLELYSYYDVPAISYRRILNEMDVVCCATHNYLASLRDHLEEVMEYNYILGNKNIVCHYLLEEERGSRDNYLRVAETLNGLAVTLKRNGFQLLYHNHDFEFKEVFDGVNGMQLLIDQLDPQLIQFQLHIGQLPPAQLDVLEYMRKLGNRIGMLHVHTFTDQGAFDSDPAIRLGKELNVPWAVLENVYPRAFDTADLFRDVHTVRESVRK